MLTRWQGAFASVVVSTLAVALVVLDLTVDGVRLWWAAHALTTDVVSGLVVLALTVLVCNQVITIQQVRARSTVIAAQAAIVMAQAARTAQAIGNVRGRPAEVDAAAAEFQSYVTLLSIATPVLIDTELTRQFLEDAQCLAAALSRALRDLSRDGVGPERQADDARYLEGAVGNLRDASVPLVKALSPDLRSAIAGGEAAS